MSGIDTTVSADDIRAVIPAGADIKEGAKGGGPWFTATFPNRYGVSIINNQYSYGLEMAVLHPDGLCYASPVTDDVLGYLTLSGLRDAVLSVMSLPERTDCSHSRDLPEEAKP